MKIRNILTIVLLTFSDCLLAISIGDSSVNVSNTFGTKVEPLSSGIYNISWNKQTYYNLDRLCRIWGVVKYFHPAVAKGEFDMDQELLNVMPKVVSSGKDCNAVLTEWVRHFGGMTSSSLLYILGEIKSTERVFPSYYITCDGFIGNPVFNNEKIYLCMDPKDDGIRMLALFRYWNMINYFYPYKHLLKDWDGVLHRYLPIFAKAKTRHDYQGAIMRICSEIKDSHGVVIDNKEAIEKNTYNMPIYTYFGSRSASPSLVFISDTLVVKDINPLVEEKTDSKVRSYPLRRGDIILRIDGRRVDDIIAERMPYMSASNYEVGLRDMSVTMLCTNDSIIKVKYQRGKRRNTVILPTYNFKDINPFAIYSKKDTCFKMIGDIAYINPGTWKNSYLTQIWPQLKCSKGLIIDLREYPSDYIVYTLGSKLYPEAVQFVKIRMMDIEHPGKYIDAKSMNIKGDSDYYRGNIVILNNEDSKSQSEFTTMALRKAPHAIVMGTHTAGADGNVSEIFLPGGIATYISGIEVLYPDGSQTQQIGLQPDIEVKPTVESVAKGEDYLLQQAINYLCNK